MAGRCGIYWMRWVRRVTQRWCMVYAQISAEPCWLLNVSMAAASSKETAEASEPKDWCRDLYQRILTILTLFNNHGKSHGRWVRSSQKMFLIPTAIMVHRCPSSMWYLCIHCAGRVIDILMQPEYRKCWRPTWLAKLWVFNTMPVQSLATHERRNGHYTAGFLENAKGCSEFWSRHSSCIYPEKCLFSAGHVCPNPSDPKELFRGGAENEFLKVVENELGFRKCTQSFAHILLRLRNFDKIESSTFPW